MKLFQLFHKQDLPIPGGAYTLGALLVVATLALRVLLLPGFQIPILVIFVPAILATSTLGGFRPGLVATALACTLADYVLLPPFFAWTHPVSDAAMDLASLAVTGIATAGICALLRKAIQQSEAAKAELARALHEADRLSIEQQKTEKALRESLVRLEKVLDNQTVGAVFWDMNTGLMVDANKTFLDTTGYSEDDVTSRRLFWYNLTPPEYMEASRAEVERFLQTGRFGPYEKEYFCKDGSRKWLLFAGSSLGDNQCIEFCVDISARKKAERELVESETRLRAVLDTLPSAVFFADTDGRVVEANRSTREVWGDAPMFVDTADLSSVYKGWWPDTGKPVESLEWPMSKAVRGETVRNAVIEIRDFDGTHKFIRVFAAPVRGPDGENFGAVAVNEDISEQRRAEEALQRQANLLMQSFDAIIVWRLDGAIEWWNTGAEKLYGYSAAEAIGQETHSLLATDFLQPWAEIQTQLVESGSWEGELRHRTRDGGEVVVSARKQLLRDADGTIRVLETNRDVTERTQYEAHLRVMRDQLAHVGRLSELAQVSAGIAHELNQPLAAMMNYSNLAKRLIANPDSTHLERALDAIAKATEQAERAGLIIRRMRGFIEKRETNRVDENVNAIVEEAVALGLLGTQGDGITTELNLGENLPPICVDRVQIQQVIVNLMRNAIEAMAHSPQRTLTLSTSCSVENEVVISIRDTGPGLSKDYADRLFMPFFTTKPGGMGIGLVISHSIIEAHGGRLTVESEPGLGANFECRLPATGCEPAGNRVNVDDPMPRMAGGL
jgi:two-component system sensor kinase FixL